MDRTAICFYFVLFFLSGLALGQEEITYSSAEAKPVEINSCQRVHVEDKAYNALSKKSFAVAQPYYARAFNAKDDFVALQLGKRKGSKVFLYIKLFRFNACIKNTETLEILTENGISFFFKNKFKVNCDGEMVVELSKKDIENLANHKISSFMLMSFQKDYEFHFDAESSQKFAEDLMCLESYKL